MRHILTTILLFLATTTVVAQEKAEFTAAEQQQIIIATPGLFDRSDIIQIDFTELSADEYCFPLPVGKAHLAKNNSQLEISTSKGDAVKAMFDGQVRLSYKHPELGNVIVVRHNNGLETMYALNAQNMVHVGDKVKAGQTVAIVGGIGVDVHCLFAIMINGRRINPETIIELNSHRLRKITLKCKKKGERIEVSTTKHDGPNSKVDYDADPFAKSSQVRVNLKEMKSTQWAYPLPGAKVISPYGGKRRHSGVDLKTKPNDEIVAAFDGVVTRSGPFSGYGNCIEIKHGNGLSTLYSHQSKNMVKAGDKVKAGQVIGLTGRTGRATTEHLHFEVKCNGRGFDPAVVFDHSQRSIKPIVLVLNKNGSVKAEK